MREFSNKAFRGAFQKGVKARKAGKGRHQNPYKDYRTDGGQVTFSRAFWKCWNDGWDSVDKGDDR